MVLKDEVRNAWTFRGARHAALFAVAGLWALPLAGQPLAPHLPAIQAGYFAPPAGPAGVFAETLAVALPDGTAEAYAARGWEPLWTGPEDAPRRAALLGALSWAPAHGLPAPRYDAAALARRFHEVMGERDRALLEAEVTRAFLAYARDVSSGALEPGRVDAGLVREVARPDPGVLLARIAREDPEAVLAALPPQSAEYAALLREHARLRDEVAAQGASGVRIEPARPGARGSAVAALRARLAVLGHPAGEGAEYDAALTAAVRAFQAAHGLAPDGVAGPATAAELNRDASARLAAVLVALERERWMNVDRGARHIWVNLTDFAVKVIDEGEVTFETRAVIGKDTPDRRTPEFSDLMNHMVINPSWFVPRSIATKEYLPQLQQNPAAAGHLLVVDRSGRAVDRAQIDFAAYTPASFPYSMRQPPGDGNALGKVKFMFPNKWNIYLHDTPAKSLFGREERAFSHGCVRLADPFDFAYVLLGRQEADPQAFFQRILRTGRETRVNLREPVPIHIDYRTALTDGTGAIVYRRDVYGRDARIFDALVTAGVSPGPVQG